MFRARAIYIALLLAIAITIPGCLIGSSTKTSTEGTPISETTLRQITPGSSPEHVLNLLGHPAVKTTGGDGTEVWKWSYRESKKTSGSFFLIVSSETQTDTEGRVYVSFRDGRVVETWRD
jgi:outer membrane protein assembly factor BamE (lipoprotein component of BamABCDE complex)